MYINKNVRRIIAASIMAGSFTIAPVTNIDYCPIVSIAQAKVQMYEGVAEDYASEIESQDIAKLRARDKAIRKATEKAGVYLKSYSRSINAILQDDEITAIASNSYQLVGDVKYERMINKATNESTIIIWKATVNVNVDDTEVQSWLKRDYKDRSTIVTQTNESRKAAEENTRQVEDLRKSANNAKTEQERNNIKSQFETVDKEFLANQKKEEGNELYYQQKYNEAIKKYNEALALKPNLAEAYNNRGVAYALLKDYNNAIKDFTKSIELNQNEAKTYQVRGICYQELGETEKAEADFAKAKALGYND